MMAGTIETPNDSGIRARIGRFFYAEEIPYGLALTRIMLPLVLLSPMLSRWSRARELFSTDGAPTPLWNAYGWPNMLPEVPGALAVALISTLIVCLVNSSIGWCTRFSLVVSTVLYTYLNLVDAISTMTKYSVVATHLLLLLSLSRCGDVWSVDAWLRRRHRPSGTWPGEPALAARTSPAWPRRLMQFLIGFVYFGAAITKLHTTSFFSGDQLQSWMLTNVNRANPLGEQMALYPAVLVIGAYCTIVWEMLFLFVSWSGWGRAVMLVPGLGFHAMTWFALGLHTFPLVCVSTYFAFLNEDDFRKAARLVRRIRRRLGRLRTTPATRASYPAVLPARRLPLPSPALMAGLLVIVAVASIEVEYWLDPYGKRRPEGSYALKELDPQYVETVLLAPIEPIRPEDKIFDLQAGTVLVGGILANPRTEFRQGELLTAQCTLTLPHEDMWLDCSLHDSQGRMVDTLGQLVSREMLRSNFYYELSDALEPGDYSLVLKIAGREVLRRSLVLRPRTKAPVAN